MAWNNATVRKGLAITGKSLFGSDGTILVTSTAIAQLSSSSCSEGSQIKDICSVMDTVSKSMAQTLSKFQRSAGYKLTRAEKKLLEEFRCQGKKIIQIAKAIQNENEELKAKIKDLETKVASLEEKEKQFEIRLDEAMQEIDEGRKERIKMRDKMESTENSVAEMKEMFLSMSFPSSVVSGYSTMASDNDLNRSRRTDSSNTSIAGVPDNTQHSDIEVDEMDPNCYV